MQMKIIFMFSVLVSLAACSSGPTAEQFIQLKARVQKLEQENETGGLAYQNIKINEFDRLLKKQLSSNKTNQLNNLQQITDLQADIQALTQEQELSARQLHILQRKNQALEQQLKK